MLPIASNQTRAASGPQRATGYKDLAYPTSITSAPVLNQQMWMHPDARVVMYVTFDGSIIDLGLRFADANNYWSVRVNAAGSLLLNLRHKAVTTNKVTTAGVMTSGNEYKVEAILEYNVITVKVNDVVVTGFPFTDPDWRHHSRRVMIALALGGGIREVSAYPLYPGVDTSGNIQWAYQRLENYLYDEMAAFQTYMDTLTPTTNKTLGAYWELLTANANSLNVGTAPALAAAISANHLYLDFIDAIGCEGITLNVGFPYLVPVYNDAGSTPNPNIVNNRAFYADVIAYAKSLGLGVCVEVNFVFNSVTASPSGVNGFDYLTYFPTTDQLLAALTAQCVYVVQNYAPDICSIVGEPAQDFTNSGRTWSVARFKQFVDDTLAALTAAGIRNTSIIACGSGSWENQSYFTEFMTNTACDMANIHIYPIKDNTTNFYQNAVVMADLALANSKRIIYSQTSLFKVAADDVAAGLDYVAAYKLDQWNRWLPLDMRFLQIMRQLCKVRSGEMFTFFWTSQMAAYLPFTRRTRYNNYIDAETQLRQAAAPLIIALTPNALGTFYGALGG